MADLLPLAFFAVVALAVFGALGVVAVLSHHDKAAKRDREGLLAESERLRHEVAELKALVHRQSLLMGNGLPPQVGVPQVEVPQAGGPPLDLSRLEGSPSVPHTDSTRIRSDA